ncbi:MAG: InlB B-repeat-containing protein [Treponema sp.]|nr:InlB B-repeat-containing protein [Treponema sp.]
MPVISAVAVTISDDGTTVTINFTSTRAGTYYIVVCPATPFAPTSGAQIESSYSAADVKASAPASAGVNTAGLSGLSTGTAYQAHVTVKDAAGRYSNVWSESFTQESYLITYHLNGGSGAVDTAYTSAQLPFTLPTAPTVNRTGYTFGGWYGSSALSGSAVTQIAAGSTGNKEFWARWTGNQYTVTFNANGGDAAPNPVSKSVTYGDPYGELAAVSRTNYTFAGWFTGAADGTQVTADTTVSITANQTLYAHWTVKTVDTYTITYHLDGGSGADDTAYTSAQLPFTLSVPVRPGYSFGGWYDNSALSGNAVTQIAAGSTGNKEFWAGWTISQYTVTFSANGGGTPSPASKSVVYGDPYGDLATTNRMGCSFAGWFTEAVGGTEVTADTTLSIMANHTLYAHWTLDTYTITYHLNGGSGASDSTYTFESAAIKLPVPGRPGYSFSGWYGNSDLSGNAVTQITAGSTGNKEFWAMWTANQYSVTFNANGGGAPNFTSKRVLYGAAYGELATVSRTDYTFAGWYTEAGGGTEVTASTIVTITSSQTLYAHWAASTYTYTVTFNANGGDAAPVPASKQVTYGTAYGDLATVSRTYYTFAGWYTAAGGGTEVTASTVVAITANQTLYAHWTAIGYTITYHLNGGSGASNSTYTIESAAITLPTAPTVNRAGYSFGGWYSNSALSGNAVTQIAAGSTGNKEFWAKWTGNQYTVTFNANGGGTPSFVSKQVTCGAAYGDLATVSRTDYTFAGWYTAASGGTGVTASTIVVITDNHILYAHWNVNLEEQKAMVSIPGMTVTGSGSSGVFIAGRNVTLSAFKIARYETTYEVWYEVKTWAASRGYTFTNAGREGRDGTDGAAPTIGAKTHPVTMVSWRDSVVWCNAYSEMTGKTPVYYSDSGYSTVIKALADDTVYMNPGANGYRLPTEAEWEAAARGGNPSNTTNWGYTYAGSNTIDDVAWWSSNRPDTCTSPIGQKAANGAGLYDMSGNVIEWCWDWYDSISTGTVINPTGASSGGARHHHVYRGGSWLYGASTACTVVRRENTAGPDTKNTDIGFRVVCR